MNFKNLKLNNKILKAVEETGYDVPTEIQIAAIPFILDNRDIMASAQTGTGKTAAFALPLLEKFIENRYNKVPKILVLSPTRELAVQTRDNFKKYSKYLDVKTLVILGGVRQGKQTKLFKDGVDIIIATPGRLLDLIKQKHVNLKDIETLVLDEADTMLDMGFIKDIKKIINFIPVKKQTLMFSATMPKAINELAKELLVNPETIKIGSAKITVNKIEQKLYHVEKVNKTNLLIEILNNEDVKSALIFTKTKHGADKLGENLKKNSITCEVIHGDKNQSSRTKALLNFKTKKVKVLVATDVAARGIDITELTHVINFELPNNAESYIHRIGRTGRAGLSGVAISFCDPTERKYLKDIQRLIKEDIKIVDHNYKIEFVNKPKFDNKSKTISKSKSNNKPRSYSNISKQGNKPKSDKQYRNYK